MDFRRDLDEKILHLTEHQFINNEINHKWTILLLEAHIADYLSNENGYLLRANTAYDNVAL